MLLNLKNFRNENNTIHHTKVDQSKNWFLGILGHDLRSPLSTVSTAQQLLSISENLTENDKKMVKTIDSSTKRMQELIDNLLELVNLRLGSGISINKTPTDLTVQCEQIVQEFQITYPKADLSISSPGPVQGEWDNVRIKQITSNFIG